MVTISDLFHIYGCTGQLLVYMHLSLKYFYCHNNSGVARSQTMPGHCMHLFMFFFYLIVGGGLGTCSPSKINFAS